MINRDPDARMRSNTWRVDANQDPPVLIRDLPNETRDPAPVSQPLHGLTAAQLAPGLGMKALHLVEMDWNWRVHRLLYTATDGHILDYRLDRNGHLVDISTEFSLSMT